MNLNDDDERLTNRLKNEYMCMYRVRIKERMMIGVCMFPLGRKEVHLERKRMEVTHTTEDQLQLEGGLCVSMCSRFLK
jgi:hypothetical protein